MPRMRELAEIKQKYDRIRGALDQVEAVGYGIVMPSIDELTLEEPEIVRQGGRYGVKLRASAPSIHMMRADITTEVAPIVGSEKQSEDLVRYLLCPAAFAVGFVFLCRGFAGGGTAKPGHFSFSAKLFCFNGSCAVRGAPNA